MKNLFVITILILSTTLYADWDNEQKLTASDATEDDHFGNSVSIDGDYAVIGAIWEDDGSGAAYIFHRNGTNWTEQAKITASDGTAEDMFGYSVSISGDYAVVGAYMHNDNHYNVGAAYIFHRNGTNWTQQARIGASGGAEDDKFGWSVSIDGDYVVIGSPGDDDIGNGAGSAYLFHRNGTSWGVLDKVTASDGAKFDNFGNSVSISGDYVVVGALWDDIDGTRSGSAYIFHRYESNWTEKAKITSSDGEDEDWFGHSVSISGDYSVIGAYGNDDDGSNSGAAYIFHRSGTDWEEQAKLTASDGEQFDNFGYTTSISGNYVAIGAGFNGNNGAAYIFHRSGTEWTEDTKLLASDGQIDDWFGRSVSISGYYALIGAWQDDDNGAGSGSAYLYTNTSPQSCLPEGVTFSSQEDIDNFQSDYPGCTEIEGGVVIDGDAKNGELKNLDGLSILTAIGGHLSIQNNMYLESLTGLDNINAGSISDLTIIGNASLSTCEVQSVCEYLASPNGEIEIHDNSNGCNSLQEVKEACGTSLAEVFISYDIFIFPNPFSTSTTIEYELNHPQTITITFFNQFGKLVDVIEERQQKGLNKVIWTPINLADGIYYFRLEAGDQMAIGKIVLVD